MKIMTMALMKMMRCAEKGEMAEMMRRAEMAMMNMTRCAEKGGWSLMGVTEMPVTTFASASNVGSCFA